VLSGQRQSGHQEELRAAVGGVEFERFAEQRDSRFGSPEKQFGKSAVEEEDAVPPIGRIQSHGPLHRRQCLPGATEEGGIVAGETVRSGQSVIHCQRLRERICRLFQPSCRGVEHALNVFCAGMHRLKF
jgi:hypothetical protein